MRSRPFESAASELVDEGAHPLDQLEVLEDKARDLEALGETDTVIECRIKQLALQQVLVDLHEFPLQPLIRAQAALAEAYAAGGFFKQARQHLELARETSKSGIHDAMQCQRLQADLLLAEGALCFAEAGFAAAKDAQGHATSKMATKSFRSHVDNAAKVLHDADNLVRKVFGSEDIRIARIHTMLGQIAQQRKKFDDAIAHFETAWEVHDSLEGGKAGEMVARTKLRIAEAQYLAGKRKDALETQEKVVDSLQRANSHPAVLVESLAQLARWLEAEGRDNDALEKLQYAETAVKDNFGDEDAQAVDIKRDVALLHLKLGKHDIALQYLNELHYLERRHHGSHSANVGRTLKALGTVHLVKQNIDEAENCLVQALRIFESEHAANGAVIRDIHAKLATIATMPLREP